MAENTLELTPDELATLRRIKDRQAVVQQIYRVTIDDLERRLLLAREEEATWWREALAARGLAGEFGIDLNAQRPTLQPLVDPSQPAPVAQ